MAQLVRSISVLALAKPVLCLVASALMVAAGTTGADAAGQAAIPSWLQAHVGEADGQISLTVLERARSLYRRKLGEGSVRNPCYFAMDATRPGDMGGGRLGRRFYVVCEAEQSFRAISAGHGSGHDLKGAADFANGRTCVKNFGNAKDSDLTMGGAYVTGEEGYPGLVVHGPLIATLLLDLLHRHAPGAAVSAFSFKAVRPTFDLHPFTVLGQPAEDGRTVRLWAHDHEGWLTMQATATLR